MDDEGSGLRGARGPHLHGLAGQLGRLTGRAAPALLQALHLGRHLGGVVYHLE